MSISTLSSADEFVSFVSGKHRTKKQISVSWSKLKPLLQCLLFIEFHGYL